jgi:hypothetical protein
MMAKIDLYVDDFSVLWGISDHREQKNVIM